MRQFTISDKTDLRKLYQSAKRLYDKSPGGHEFKTTVSAFMKKVNKSNGFRKLMLYDDKVRHAHRSLIKHKNYAKGQSLKDLDTIVQALYPFRNMD